MVKMCKFDSSKRCYHLSCSVFDGSSGNISVCPLYQGGNMIATRKVGLLLHGIFDKHASRRG